MLAVMVALVVPAESVAQRVLPVVWAETQARVV